MSGMEMLLINTLKAFMPKESAEKIAGWATDGTFDKIGALPSDVEWIKNKLADLDLKLGLIHAALQRNAIYSASGYGFDQTPSGECGTAIGPGSSLIASGNADNGDSGVVEAGGGA